MLAKLAEEMAEFEAELAQADPARLGDELGDMLFVIANLARKLKLDPETCLRGATGKFQRRFEAIEAKLAVSGRSAADASLQELEAAWQEVKANDRSAGRQVDTPSGDLP